MLDSIEYIPQRLVAPPRMVAVPTAWDGCELILADLIERFHVPVYRALEFGVDYGYSIAAIANYFRDVYGVDTFEGDGHAGFRKDLFAQTQNALKFFDNISLICSSAEEFMEFEARSKNTPHFNLIHVDLFHVFDLTHKVGTWAVEHSDITIFHDTISFPEVKRACLAIANQTGRTFYEYRVQHGLGILVKE